MPDYSAPTTPAEVCERIEDALRAKASRFREEASVLIKQAEAVEQAAMVAFDEKMTYERHQPKTHVEDAIRQAMS